MKNPITRIQSGLDKFAQKRVVNNPDLTANVISAKKGQEMSRSLVNLVGDYRNGTFDPITFFGNNPSFYDKETYFRICLVKSTGSGSISDTLSKINKTNRDRSNEIRTKRNELPNSVVYFLRSIIQTMQYDQTPTDKHRPLVTAQAWELIMADHQEKKHLANSFPIGTVDPASSAYSIMYPPPPVLLSTPYLDGNNKEVPSYMLRYSKPVTVHPLSDIGESPFQGIHGTQLYATNPLKESKKYPLPMLDPEFTRTVKITYKLASLALIHPDTNGDKTATELLAPR